MSTDNHGIRYDEEFKRTIVNLYQNGGKTQATICKEYGMSPVTLSRCIKQYSTVKVDDGEIFSSQPAERTKENQKIAKIILKIYADYQKHLGAYKITHVLKRDYGVSISIGRVYRLMLTLKLPPHVYGKALP